MTVTPLTSAEFAAKAQQTAAIAQNSPNTTQWKQDVYVPATTESPYLNYEKPESVQIVELETCPIKLGLEAIVDDELFASIVKKHGGGLTTNSFSRMLDELYDARLITKEQGYALMGERRWMDYNTMERVQNTGTNNFSFGGAVEKYYQNFDEFFNALLDWGRYLEGSETSFSSSYNVLRDFSEKISESARDKNG